MNTVNERQIGGSHYASKYQHWDFVRLCLANRYLEGCVTKYVARHRKKNGVQDLEKALHYLDKIIELHEGDIYEGLVQDLSFLADDNTRASPADFCLVNELGQAESFIVRGLTHWNNVSVLQEIRAVLVELTSREQRAVAQLQAAKAGAGPVTRRHEPGEEPGPGYVAQGQDEACDMGDDCQEMACRQHGVAADPS